MLVLDCLDPPVLAAFWAAALGYERSSSIDPYVVLVPGGAGPELLLQRVPEPKVVKNRMHLDLRADDLEKEVERLERLGARRLEPAPAEEQGCRWVVMADPEGNEFCVCAERQPVCR